MYSVEVDGYVRIVDEKDNEVLHIEFDAYMDDIIDELNKFVENINKRL